MKQFSSPLTSWWLDTMAPLHAPMTTLAERETMRKRRLLSGVMSICLLLVLSYIGYMSLTVITSEISTCLLTVGCVIFALWINRQGYLKLASLIYFFGIGAILLLGAQSTSLANPHILIWMCFSFTIFLAVAGLFIPSWLILLLAVLENVLFFWYLLVIYHTQMTQLFSPEELQNFLSFLCIMIYDSAIVGILYATTTKKALIQADRAVELELVHRDLSKAYHHLEDAHTQLEVAHATIQQQALTDPLTRLPNHRAILEQIEKEVDRTQRFDRTVSLLFFDLDHFKALNDGYGHGAGDEALRTFGQLLRHQIRDLDTVGRWGGEEFLAILPETTVHEARAIAERMREAVSQHIFAIGGGLHLTCSIGIACSSSHTTTQEALIRAADQAMYAAKRLGRNQVRVIDEDLVQAILTGEQQEGNRETTALQGFIDALASLIEQRDAALGQHSNEVSTLAHQMALHLGISGSEAWMMQVAGQLHDIGKIGVPEAILQKPARLTKAEWQLIQQHPTMGAEVVSHIPGLRPLSPMIRAHHERWDGAGYPDQLKNEAIPLGARVIAVIDAYTAMLVNRPYQQARSAAEAVAELRRCAGTQFDPDVVEALATVLQQARHEEPVSLAA